MLSRIWVLTLAVASVLPCRVACAAESSGAEDTGTMPGAEARAAVARPPDPASSLGFLPDIVARYGKNTVTAEDVRNRALPQLHMRLEVSTRAGRAVTAQQMDEWARTLAPNVVDQIIDQRLLLERAQKDGTSLDVASARQRAGAQFEQALKRLGKEKVEANLSRQGITREEAVEQLAQQLAEQAAFSEWVQAKFRPDQPVADEDVRRYYEENLDKFRAPGKLRASHILIEADARNASSGEKAHKEAEKLLKQLADGADFGRLAKKHSDCPSSRNGGDLGPFATGQMVPAFEEAVASLAPGELSGVVETRFGYHIIKGGEPEPARTKPYAEVEAQLRQQLGWQKVNDALRNLAKEAREQVGVEVLIADDE